MTARDLEQHLGRLLADCAELNPRPMELDDIERALFRPLKAAMVGGVGVGKTTLVAALTGQERVTGLGGVTHDIESIDGAAWTWVDTPGIDDPRLARGLLDPEVSQVDVVLWVVDGLQPATERERSLIVRWARDRELRVFVSRCDLLSPDDLHAVRSRVDEIAGQLSAGFVLYGDARTPSEEQVHQLLQRPRLSRRREAHIRASLESLRATLERRSLSSLHTAAESIREQWRLLVQKVRKVSERPLEPQPLIKRVRDASLDALRELDLSIRDPSQPWAAQDLDAPHIAAPKLPAPPSAMGHFFRGRPGFERDLERSIMDWYLHGNLLLNEWLGGGRALVDQRDIDQTSRLLPDVVAVLARFEPNGR